MAADIGEGPHLAVVAPDHDHALAEIVEAAPLARLARSRFRGTRPAARREGTPFSRPRRIPGRDRASRAGSCRQAGRARDRPGEGAWPCVNLPVGGQPSRGSRVECSRMFVVTTTVFGGGERSQTRRPKAGGGVCRLCRFCDLRPAGCSAMPGQCSSAGLCWTRCAVGQRNRTPAPPRPLRGDSRPCHARAARGGRAHRRPGGDGWDYPFSVDSCLFVPDMFYRPRGNEGAHRLAYACASTKADRRVLYSRALG